MVFSADPGAVRHRRVSRPLAPAWRQSFRAMRKRSTRSKEGLARPRHGRRVASLLKQARASAASFPTLFEEGDALLRAGRPRDALRLYAEMEKATRTGEAAAADPRIHFNSGYA